MREKLGICQWFHYLDERALERAVAGLRELGVKHVRTGISWADSYRPLGRRWNQRVLAALEGFEVLLSVWHTPPSIAEEPSCAAPPRRLRDYADFIDQVITDHGAHVAALELWNEPNNRFKWDFPRFDPQWRKFGEMAGTAAYWARQRGMRTVLGGMIPVDPHWLGLMRDYGALPHMDAVGIHAFPEMWWEGAPNWEWARDWRGWDEKIAHIAPHAEGRPIWVTETGLATWNLRESREDRLALQALCLERAAQAPAERVYWYTLYDLDPSRTAIEGFHVDENEYHLGLIRHDGSRKDAYWRFHDLLRMPEPARTAAALKVRPSSL